MQYVILFSELKNSVCLIFVVVVRTFEDAMSVGMLDDDPRGFRYDPESRVEIDASRMKFILSLVHMQKTQQRIQSCDTFSPSAWLLVITLTGQKVSHLTTFVGEKNREIATLHRSARNDRATISQVG